MTASIAKEELKNIYGTLNDLDHQCDRSKDCWKDILNQKHSYDQKPYKPYLGENYKGIYFTGINLNGGNESLNAIDILVNLAIEKYLKQGKYLIFRNNDKKDHYKGSPFYYYVPLLSFLYHSYLENGIKFFAENNISSDQIISGFDYCGLSNIIKCSINSLDGRGKPSAQMFINCAGKFKKELELIAWESLVIFTYSIYPGIIKDHFSDFNLLEEGETFRIYSLEGKYVLELGHPVDSSITRVKKFDNYSKAIYRLVDLIKTN